VVCSAARRDINKYETWWRGSTENIFVEFDRKLIWIGTHEGTYCLSCPALGKPVTEPTKVAKWSVRIATWDGRSDRAQFLFWQVAQSDGLA